MAGSDAQKIHVQMVAWNGYGTLYYHMDGLTTAGDQAVAVAERDSQVTGAVEQKQSSAIETNENDKWRILLEWDEIAA